MNPACISRRARLRARSSLPLAALATIAVLGFAPAAAPAVTGGAGQVEGAPALTDTPYDRHGMWIWYLERSNGGSIPAIVAQAKRAGIGTVYVKAGDGASAWSQFSRGLVRALHHGGLDVCAWQFVYGERPVAEARVAAAAVAKGADCFVIDAEGDYEGKYAAADLYIRTLRGAIGETFPLSLAAFPYVDYHPSFPYSVFFGPGGATFNQPQMYWKTIGTSVRGVFEHTYLYNRIWGHPIHPLGQTYEAPGRRGLKLFRRFAASFGDLQPSWWDWQETEGREWGVLGARSPSRPVDGYSVEVAHPLLKRGSEGDMVVWAQERLITAGQAELPVNGIYGRLTIKAVKSFQEGHGLPVDGRIGTDTWGALLNFTPYRMRWAAAAGRDRVGARPSGTADASRAASRLRPRRPLSASLPPLANEIDPGPGA